MNEPLDIPGRSPDADELMRAIHALDKVRDDFATQRVDVHLGRDLVTVLLHYTLTAGEQELVGQGSDRAVLELRYELQMLMKVDLVAAVEASCGRVVDVFTSANHVQPNVGVEVFLLGEPIAAGRPQPASVA